MISFIIRRVLYMVPILFVVTVIIFSLLMLQGGNIVAGLCGLACPPDLREAMEERFGLNDPAPVQYLRWVYSVVGSPEVTGDFPFIKLSPPDFGYSIARNMPAMDALLGENRWVWTITLVFSALILSWLIAIPIGIYSATHKYSLADHSFTALGFLGISIPNFVLGLTFLWLVVGVFRLGIQDPFFKIGGVINPEYVGAPFSGEVFLNFLWHFLPPVLILAASSTSTVIRYMRGSLLDVLEMAYVKTARAKGLKERVVIYKHALRNAINPLISMLGFWIPYLMEGALIVAIVFNLPQLETTFFNAVRNLDNNVVLSGLFVFSLILMVGNLVSDLLLAISDPKIRYE
jgi:peptide/nickel transport system permease protein